MSSRARAGLGLVALGAVIVAVIAMGLRQGSLLKPQNLNILVVSACSLRWDHIGALNPKYSNSPKIDAWAKSAFTLTDAIAERPWQNYAFEARALFDREALKDKGYRGFRHRRLRGGHHFIIPPTTRTDEGETWYWDEDSILRYQDSLAELRAEVTSSDERPFYIFTHLKYMHYPYLDRINWKDSDLAQLSSQSRALLDKYLAAPERYDAQLPLLAVMLNSFDLLKKKFGVSEEVLSTSGVVSDPERNARWSRTAGYPEDLRLVRELYDLKMRKFDEMASEILHLFGNPRVQENTVVIFTGDHGEAHMDHGVLGHSVNVYDEMLRYPLFVKFPGQTRGERLEGQVNHRIMAELVQSIARGEVDEAGFARAFRARAQDVLLARNCADTIRTARSREWKFIKNYDSGRNELYNLLADPGERVNVIDQHPDVAWRLEEQLLEREGELLRANRLEAKSKVCLPR